MYEQTTQQHGSNQPSISNLLQRSSTSSTRSIPHDFNLDPMNQSSKRRKSTPFALPPHQPDQYMQQGQFYGIPQPQVSQVYYITQPSQQLPSVQQPMVIPSSRNSNSGPTLPQPQPLGFADALNQRQSNSNNDIFNNLHDKSSHAMLSTSISNISNQNSHLVSVPSQIMSQQPQIGFQNHINHINNSQQMLQQQEILRPSPVPVLYQPIQPILPNSLTDQLYNDNISMSMSNMSGIANISTQEPIQSILQKLNIIKSELENKEYYQTRCDELCSYLLNNENVYAPACQELLFQCLKIIKHKFSFCPGSAQDVFRNVNINRFNSPTYQGPLRKWYNEINKPSSHPQRSPSMMRIRQQQQQQILIQQQQQQQQQPIHPTVNVISQPRIEQRPTTDIEKANANWISRIIDRAWGHVMLPYESQSVNQHQAKQDFVNSFYVPHEKFDRMWKPDTPFPQVHTHPNKLPIGYRLISRKPGNLDDDNKCDWPPEEANFTISINDNEVKLHRKQRIPIKQNQYSFVGVDKPVDIVQHLVAGVNRIKITQCMCEPCRQQLCEHILSIEILVKESEDIVLRNARTQTLTPEHGTEIVKRLISGPCSMKPGPPTSPASSLTGQNNIAMLIDDDDCDITVNKMKVSLRCPISLLRISEPAKGQNCRHIGCFDLQTYVNVNKKNSKWRCPECNDRVTSETLRTDEYFKILLRQIPENVNTVELDSSGKWTVVGQDECDGGETTDDDDMQIDSISKRSSLTSSKSEKTSAAIIILDDDDEPETTSNNNNNNNNNIQQKVSLSQNNNNLPGMYSSQPPPLPPPSRPTSGVPQYIRPNTQTNDRILIQSSPPPPPVSPITSTPITQSPPDTTIFSEPIRTSNNNITATITPNITTTATTTSTKSSKRKAAKRAERRSRREMASQEKGNSSKDDNDNNNNNNSSSVGWLPVQQNYHTMSSQDIISQTATQVASPISPVSTNPNYSHAMQDKEEGEWLTEEEEEEVVASSSFEYRY